MSGTMEFLLVQALSLVLPWTAKRPLGDFRDRILFYQKDNRLILISASRFVLVKIEIAMESKLWPSHFEDQVLYWKEAQRLRKLLAQSGRIERASLFAGALQLDIVLSDGEKEKVSFADKGVYSGFIRHLASLDFSTFPTKVNMRPQDFLRALRQFRGKNIEVTIERGRLIIIGRDKEGKIIEKTVGVEVRGALTTRFFNRSQLSQIVRALLKDLSTGVLDICIQEFSFDPVGLERGPIRFMVMPVFMLRGSL